MQDFIDSLDLPFEGKMSGSEYIITVDNSNDYSKLYSKVSLDKRLSCEDDSVATEKESMFIFTDGVYDVKLTADFNKDIYKCIISER